MRDQIIADITNVLAENGFQPCEKGTCSHFIDDMGMDSLDILEVATELENKFNVGGLTDAIGDYHTIDELASIIDDKINACRP